MQLTRAADYALRVMIHMASAPNGTKVRLKELADGSEAPEKFLAKLLQQLTKTDLVASRRGPSGGFELSEKGRSATVMDVVEAIEGPVALNVCLSEAGCERQQWCPAHSVWAQAQDAMSAVLRRHTIQQLAQVGEQRKAFLSSAIPPVGSADKIAVQGS